MKTIVILFLCAIIAAKTYAQNTFPASGSVGIGTLNPSTALEVNGSITATGPYSFIAKAPDGYWGFNHANFYAGRGGNVYSLGFSSGAIGIFNGSVTAEDVFLFNKNDPNGGYIVLKANNNVGIGTTNPTAKLEVAGNSELFGTSNKIYGNFDAANYYFGHYPVSGSDGLDIHWYGGVRIGTSAGTALQVLSSGNVGIGTTNPTQKLSVNGTVQAKEVIVQTGWSDYVFRPDYHLESLSDVEAHIKAHGTLPGVPSEAQVAKEGIGVGEMQAKLLAKIEELTLHVIEQQKRIERLENEKR